MKLTILKANELSQPLKATVQKTGKLGFTAFTAAQLKLDVDTYVNFYHDEDDAMSPVMVFGMQASAESFRVHKSGQYFFLSTTALFDRLGYDYKSDNIICDLKRIPEADEIVGGDAYRLVVRPRKAKKIALQ